MCVTEDSLLLKWPQRSMISWVPSRPGATVFSEGGTYSCRGTYELSSSQSNILVLLRKAFASLVKNNGARVTSNEASVATPLASGDPLIGIPSYSGAQVSLRSPSKVSWASKARSGESTLITVGLF